MLIFDRFPSLDAANRFAASVNTIEPDLATEVHESADVAARRAIYPFALRGPVVLVERPYSGHDSDIETARQGGFADDTATGAEHEQALELAVIAYGGQFRGT